MNDKKYTGGREYGTDRRIEPNVFRFGNYTFVTGYDSISSTLGMYFRDREILFQKSTDGFYDTIIKANLNNEGISDFLIIYAYEDGASLSALISKSKTFFVEKRLRDEISEVYCHADADSFQYLQPLRIIDINQDGKDEIIVNLLKIDNKYIGFSCTDTIYADK